MKLRSIFIDFQANYRKISEFFSVMAVLMNGY